MKKEDIRKVLFVIVLFSSIASLPLLSSSSEWGGKFMVEVEPSQKNFTRNENLVNHITIKNEKALEEKYLLYVELWDSNTDERIAKGVEFPFEGNLPEGESKTMAMTWEKPPEGWKVREYLCTVSLIYMGGQEEDTCINRVE